MWVLQKGLFAREEWIQMLRNQVLRPCADASLRTWLVETYLGLSSCFDLFSDQPSLGLSHLL